VIIIIHHIHYYQSCNLTFKYQQIYMFNNDNNMNKKYYIFCIILSNTGAHKCLYWSPSTTQLLKLWCLVVLLTTGDSEIKSINYGITYINYVCNDF
jgi:hypothetical protein